MARVSFCWHHDDGSFSGPADQGDFDVVPLIGDRVVLVGADDDPDGVEVVERYMIMDGELGDVWNLIVKSIDIRPEIIKALGLSRAATKKRWKDFELQAAESNAEANKRMDDALRESRERRRKK